VRKTDADVEPAETLTSPPVSASLCPPEINTSPLEVADCDDPEPPIVMLAAVLPVASPAIRLKEPPTLEVELAPARKDILAPVPDDDCPRLTANESACPPASESPVENIRFPLVPLTATPVEICTAPEELDDAEEIEIVPEVVPAPVVMATSPPIDALEVPAWIDITPPEPLAVFSPATKLMPPPDEGEAELPVRIKKDPELPEEAAPLYKDTSPVEAEPSAEASSSSPLPTVPVEAPVKITTDPPVPFDDPPVTCTVAPVCTSPVEPPAITTSPAVPLVASPEKS
jgi:hypothetical protein